MTVMKLFRDAVRQFISLEPTSALKLAFPKGAQLAAVVMNFWSLGQVEVFLVSEQTLKLSNDNILSAFGYAYVCVRTCAYMHTHAHVCVRACAIHVCAYAGVCACACFIIS